MSKEILLIEDHRDIAAIVSEHLESEGYIIDYADNGTLGLQLSLSGSYDAIVLDVMLPGIDGISICKKLREENNSVPVLMLTARDTLDDKLTGFSVGADDYLLKPFDLEELSARLRALLRRQGQRLEDKIIVVHDLQINLDTQVVTRDKIKLNLTPIGKKILTILMTQSPNLVTRNDLEKKIWGDMIPDSDALRSHMYNLRKVVDRPFGRDLIKTVQSTGFKISDE